MGAIGGDLAGIGPGNKAALRPIVTRAGRHVIRVEEVGEARIERLVAGTVGTEQELLEEPGGVGAVPLGRARVRHGLDDLVLRRERRRAALGLVPDRAKGGEPRCATLFGRRAALISTLVGGPEL